MSAPDDGGPAFPQPAIAVDGNVHFPAHYGFGGMTLRDHFAGEAMKGILSNAHKLADLAEWAATKGKSYQIALVAEAYEIADEMIAERAKATKP